MLLIQKRNTYFLTISTAALFYEVMKAQSKRHREPISFVQVRWTKMKHSITKHATNEGGGNKTHSVFSEVAGSWYWKVICLSTYQI